MQLRFVAERAPQLRVCAPHRTGRCRARLQQNAPARLLLAARPGISISLTDGTQLPIQPTSDALQYSPTPGIPRLIDALTAITQAEHAPPRDVSISVGTGSQDLLAKAFNAVLSPGDALIVEAPTYSGSLAALEPMDIRLMPVRADAQGLCVDELDALLANAHAAHAAGGPAPPRVLYTIPTAGNPTGVTLTEDRRAQLYAIACKYDLLVLEDDPYYWLSFDGPERSLLARDVEGRVLRFESFSKTVAAGLRMGFVVGPPALVEAINLDSQASCLHTSGVSQAVLTALLEHWDVQGGIGPGSAFAQRMANVRAFYAAKRDDMVAAAHSAGVPELAEFDVPTGGMFIWFKCKHVSDTAALIEQRGPENKVLMVPGKAFFPGAPATPYVRASYSTASAEQMGQAMRRFADMLRE